MDKSKKSIQNKETETGFPRISILLSAILMGSVGLFVDLLSAFSIFSIVFFRGLFGIAFLNLLMVKYKLFSYQFLKQMIVDHGKVLFLLTLVNPLVIFFYFLTIRISNYALAAFLLYTNGLFLLLFMAFTREKKHIDSTTVISFALGCFGIFLIMEIWNADVFLFMTLTVGLFSGILLAAQIFLKKQFYSEISQNNLIIREEKHLDLFLAWWSLLSLIIFFLPLGSLELLLLTWIDLFYCLLLGLIPTALAFVLYNRGIKYDQGGNIVIIGYFEPLVATINSIIFQHQALSLFTLFGGGLILIANILIVKSAS